MTRYLFFAVVGTALFWCVYRLLLRREHCLNVNRFFLLSTLALSLVLPLVHPQVVVPRPTVASGGGYLLELPGMVAEAPAAAVQQSVAEVSADAVRGVDVWTVLGVLYWAGVALSVLILVVRYGVLWHKLQKYVFVRQGRFRVAVTDREGPSFSFFRYIVAGRGGMTDAELQQVLRHERLHAAQGHSWDRLAVQLVCCLLWFDPFVWLYGRDLREVHEYLADEAVLQQGGEGEYKSYLRLLYCQITQPKSHKGWVKALAALPVAALLLFANCKNQEPAQEQAVIPDGQYLVSPFTDTYRDGQLVEREFMGVLLPLEELDKHKVFADSAEAARYSDRLVVEGKAVRTVSMVNLNDSAAARWYDVAWADDRAALSWWDEEDSGKFKLAEYPGGLEAMSSYIAKSVVYPEKAKTDGVQGKVYVQFVVEPDGSVGDVTVLRGVGGECDEEALRVVKSMPKWQPATFKGNPVRSKYVMPIYYTLK